MKKFIAIFLSVLLCISLMGCGGKKSDAPAQDDADIVAGLSYTLSCRDGMAATATDITYAEGTKADDGRLNDGVYRTKEQLKDGKDSGEAVVFDGPDTNEYKITFEYSGNRAASKVVLHNVLKNDTYLTKFVYIEVGDSLDDMTEVEYNDSYVPVEGEYTDLCAEFTSVNFKFINIVFFSGFNELISFEEISVLDGNAGDNTPATEESKPEESSTPDGGNKLFGTWESIDPEFPDNYVRITFNEDGSGHYNQSGGNATVNMPITWTAIDGNITLTSFGKVLRDTPYHFEGDKLYMEDEDGRGSLFTRINQ